MAVVVNATSIQVAKSVMRFFQSITKNTVVVSQVNRVPKIVEPNVVVTLLREEPLGYVIEKMNSLGEITHTTNCNVVLQVDCYSAKNKIASIGDDAATTARVLSRMVKTNYACDFFKKEPFEIQPISASNVRNLAFINDAEQYEQRHMFEMTVNYNPSVTFEQDYFTDIDLKVAVPVDLLKKDGPRNNTNTKYFWDYYDLTHIDPKEFEDEH